MRQGGGLVGERLRKAVCLFQPYLSAVNLATSLLSVCAWESP